MAEHKIIWNIDPMSLMTEIESGSLQRSIEAAGVISEADKLILRDWVVFLATTTGMEFDRAQARKPLLELEAFLRTWRDLPAADVWAYRKRIPTLLYLEWAKQWNDAQEFFEPDAAQLPEKSLTPEQRQAAETPGSPLEQPA